MKSKKVLAALFATLMLATAVLSSGCAKKANNDESEAGGIVTLNMFVLTEEETSPEAARDVQMAINEITVPQYKMLVKINYLTADEYWDAVDAAEKETIEYMAAPKTKKQPVSQPENKTEAETAPKPIEEMSFNEAIDYVFDIDDVELTKPQIDLFVVDSYDKFRELVSDGRLAEIDIKYDRKTLTKYIHPTILSTGAVDGKTYGIPVNFAMNGKYEFLVFNKDLLDKYGYTVHDLRKVEEMGEYLSLIKQNEPGFYPISDIPELAGAEIFDDVLYSLSNLTEVSDSSYPIYFNNADYANYLKTTASYRDNGYVAAHDGVENAKYAVEYVLADSLIEREWADENGVNYQAYLYDIPRVDCEDAFKSAMCVSAYSLHKKEAAELIELFNIDAELANMLQYGISGRHYREEDGIVTFIDTEDADTYHMDNFLTGNTYIKYVTAETADYIENAKASNLSVAPSAYFGYDVSFDNVHSMSIYNCVKAFSAEGLEKIANGEMTVDDVFNISNRQLNALGCKWNESGTALMGVFGELATKQKNFAAKNTSYYIASKEAETYNDIYKSAEDLAAEQAAAEAEKAAEEAQKAAEEEAALQARIEAENAANAETEELTEEEIIASLEAGKTADVE